MPMIMGTSQRRVLNVMQSAELVDHRPDHHTQHQQHQKTGAQDGSEMWVNARHPIRVRHPDGYHNPRCVAGDRLEGALTEVL